MSLSTHQRVDTYEALTDLIKSIHDLIINPPDLKSHVDQALATIKEAKAAVQDFHDEHTKLEAKKSELSGMSKNLTAKEYELAIVSNQHKEKAEHLKSHEIEVESRHQKLIDREKAIVGRENAAADRDGLHAKRLGDLRAQEDRIALTEKKIAEREKFLDEKETKLRELLK